MLIRISKSRVVIGSSLEMINDEVRLWGDKLVNKAYSVNMFRDWLLKEFPMHTYVIEEFYMSKYPVTNSEFKEYISATNSNSTSSILLNEPDDHPVWGVDYVSISNYILWRSKKDGIAYRLPTEFEWEYAASGPAKNIFPFGNSFNKDKCNTKESGIGATTSIYKFEKSASKFGICDMAGNVEEWTSSLYTPYKGGQFIYDDLVDTCGKHYPILKGGSFALGGDLARCSRRHGPHPGKEFQYQGFRLAANTLK